MTQQRMQQAQQLLQSGEWTVTEVARTVGYAHLGHFATAFKSQFGMTPGECIGKRMSVLG
jgi:AraC-like DNA-binding protein